MNSNESFKLKKKCRSLPNTLTHKYLNFKLILFVLIV